MNDLHDEPREYTGYRAQATGNNSTANGVQLTQNTYTNGLNQQWDVNPLPATFGGDYSYLTIKAAHSRVTVDLDAFS